MGNTHVVTDKKIKTVLFDLDGTLVHSQPAIDKSLIDVLVHVGVQATLEKLNRYPGHSVGNFFEKITYDETGKHLNPKVIETLEDYFWKIYLENSGNVKKIRGVEQVFDLLEKNNIPYGVVTNKHGQVARQELKTLFPKRTFAFCFGDKEGHSLKPSPDMLDKACRMMNAPKDRVLFVGDTTTDLLAGTQYGVKTVIVGNPYVKSDPVKNVYALKNLSELYPFLKEQIGVRTADLSKAKATVVKTKDVGLEMA